MKTTTVTHMKNSLSAQLKLVKAGERVLVTDRQRPIAVLEPLGPAYGSKKLAGLMTEGVINPPIHPLNMKEFLKLPRGKSSESLSQAIIEEREES